jgi:hypothetical protein
MITYPNTIEVFSGGTVYGWISRHPGHTAGGGQL